MASNPFDELFRNAKAGATAPVDPMREAAVAWWELSLKWGAIAEKCRLIAARHAAEVQG